MGITANIHSVRSGSSSGVHQIIFSNEFDEKIEISYSSGTRMSYAHGIMSACNKIVLVDYGYYTFTDLLQMR